MVPNIGMIISKEYENVNQFNDLTMKYKDKKLRNIVFINNGIFYLNTYFSHPSQLRSIIENYFDKELYLYNHFTRSQEIKAINLSDVEEVTMASFLASIGEIVLLYAFKECDDEEISSLTIFMPEDVDSITSNQLKKLYNSLIDYPWRKINHIGVSFVNSDLNNYNFSDLSKTVIKLDKNTKKELLIEEDEIAFDCYCNGLLEELFNQNSNIKPSRPDFSEFVSSIKNEYLLKMCVKNKKY